MTTENDREQLAKEHENARKRAETARAVQEAAEQLRDKGLVDNE